MDIIRVSLAEQVPRVFRSLNQMQSNASFFEAMRGAAVECRIYAEDPNNNFYPSPGKIVRLRTPSGPGIRTVSVAPKAFL